MSKKNKKHKQPPPLPQPGDWRKIPIRILSLKESNLVGDRGSLMRAIYRARLVALPGYSWYTVAHIVKNDINLALDYGRGEWSNSIY